MASGIDIYYSALEALRLMSYINLRLTLTLTTERQRSTLESMGNRVDRCLSVAQAIRDFTSETQTAGEKLSSRPRLTPYFHFRYREKRRQFVTA